MLISNQNLVVNNLLKYLKWAIRLKQQGESHDVSKSAEKFKWFSVILEFIQNTIDSNIKLNRFFKDKDDNHKDLPAKIKISFTKVNFSNFSKNFLTEKFKKILALSKFKIGAAAELEGSDKTDLLILEDFNTTGIQGDHKKYSGVLDDGKTDNPIFRFNFYVGDDQKLDDPDLGGSEGEGRQTFYYASKISTFFYYTKREKTPPLVYGMTFVGNAKQSDGSSWLPVLKYGEEVPMRGDLNGIQTDLSYAIPSDNEEVSKIFKETIPIKRNNETGTSIVIPYYEKRYLKKEKVILKIIEVYRAQILRGQLIVDIDGEIIDETTLRNYFKEYTDAEDTKMLNTISYFDFLEKTQSIKSDQEYDLNYVKDQSLFEEERIKNFEKLIKDFNSDKIVKIRCNFLLNKKIKQLGKKEHSVKTYFDLFLKKTNDQIRSFKLNDFIRGSLSIYDERKKLDAFALLDVQDSEAKLFFKCAEGANHSIWEPNNWKLDNKRYYTESYSDLVRFAKKIPEQILRLIESKDTQPDYDIFSDLFPDLSDEGTHKQKKKKKVTEKVSVTPTFVPKIYPKIKNYEVNVSKKDDGGFSIKGFLHSKDNILSQIEQMEKEKKELLKHIEVEEVPEKKELMIESNKTIDKRIKEYNLFIENDCDNFPLNIRLKMAFEGENLGNPFRKYDPKKHFDLDLNKEFKFKYDGDISLKKCSENTIVLSATSGNFKFSLNGFSKISDYDVAIQDKQEAYS